MVARQQRGTSPASCVTSTGVPAQNDATILTPLVPNSHSTPFTHVADWVAPIVQPGPVFDWGRGSSKWPGPGFPYYSRKAGTIEVQKRKTGRRGSSYTSNESSCRVEYESTTFFEVNTYLKYFSVDKSLCIFLFSLCTFIIFGSTSEHPRNRYSSSDLSAQSSYIAQIKALDEWNKDLYIFLMSS